MKAYQYTLRGLAIAVFGVSLIHLLFGVSSEVLLGSGISQASQLDPNLDSQNRFYGAAFALFGVVFWLSSTDLAKYSALLKLSLLVFFIAGLARFIAVSSVGWPTPMIIALTIIEIVGPPGMYLWLKQQSLGAS